MTLPDIPRLYTALAEVLAVLVYAQAAPPRAAKPSRGCTCICGARGR